MQVSVYIRNRLVHQVCTVDLEILIIGDTSFMEFDFYVILRISGTMPVESFKNRPKTQKEVRQA